MFETLTERLDQVFKRLKGRGKLSEKDIKEALREVRLALLEADVNYKVVKDFITGVEAKATGHEVAESLTPAQQVIKIVHGDLIALMGGSEDNSIKLSGPSPIALMLVGLQGSGKTTTAGKIARYLRDTKKRRPYLVPADPYRPAAVEQLQTLAASLHIPCYAPGANDDPVETVVKAREQARKADVDTIIFDTAGRLHIDEELMEELRGIKQALNPPEILFVADAMTGQDAVNVATGFNDALGITGVVLTKMDGDARGGAALSIKAVTRQPIKFVGTGEKLDAWEPFYPDRMASRILGMGDVLSLIEKAEEAFDEQQAKALEKKIRKDEFNLEDFRQQLHQIKKMGPLEDILGMIPGLGKLKGIKALRPDEGQLVRVEAIVDSMTVKERHNPRLINGSRRLRIAKGSGTTVQDVNRLLKQFAMMKKMIKQFTARGSRGISPGMLPM
ncbi:MAG: signal recognition particle protein [Deltaproteobacteria bacterium RBG_16_54_18]|nr:MAG: signal recognition particle protein [Deltaproteobacteria bacterium RBG_16_54_18]